MAQITVPNAPKEYATHYDMLLGVDFQADQTEVDRRRSPDMVNMISDFGGNPVKRDGYRAVGKRYDAMVMVDGVTYGVYVTSSVLTIYSLTMAYGVYEFAETSVCAVSKNFGKVKAAFAYQRIIYILTTKAIFSYDTVSGKHAYTGIGTNMMSIGTIGESSPADADIIPLTVIDLKPDGTGGAVLDDVNIMSIYQTVSYQGDGTSVTYVIPNYSKMGTYVKAEVRDANGDWQQVMVTLGTQTHANSWRIDGTNNLDTLYYVDAEVVFDIPPTTPVVAGEDNVRITFAPYSTTPLYRFGNPTPQDTGYYNETRVALLNSGISTFQSSRMFIADKYKIYYSEVSNPFIISDLAWFEIESEVVGFTRSNSYLAVLARDNGRSTIYLASEVSRVVDSDTGETETYFAVKESNAGVGAVAPKAIATLSDEPMFLSRTGIFGILTNWTSEKYAINRSSRINRKLCKEDGLESAIAVAFNDYLYLAINGRMYILDGRHKESDRAGNKPLEAYYFEGMPAIENMWVVGDRMFFTDDTKTYTWNDELAETERYLDGQTSEVISVKYGVSDSETKPPTGAGAWHDSPPTPAAGEYLWYMAAYDDLTVIQSLNEINVGDKKMSGDPVCCKWCSTFDDDGSPQKLKTLMKKGSMVTLVPHYQSGCEITLVKDGDVFEYLGSFDSDLQTFEYIDFNRFTFSTNAVAFDNFTKKKIKKYKRLQIQVENNKAEPFGLTQITKTYTFGNYAKR